MVIGVTANPGTSLLWVQVGTIGPTSGAYVQLDSLAFYRHLCLVDQYPIEEAGCRSAYQKNDGCPLPGKGKSV